MAAGSSGKNPVVRDEQGDGESTQWRQPAERPSLTIDKALIWPWLERALLAILALAFSIFTSYAKDVVSKVDQLRQDQQGVALRVTLLERDQATFALAAADREQRLREMEMGARTSAVLLQQLAVRIDELCRQVRDDHSATKSSKP